MKRILITLAATLSLITGGQLIPQPAYAACSKSDTPKGQVEQGIGATGSDCDTSGVGNFVSTIVEILSIIVGIAAVIMIIVAGFKYITSGGDSGRASSAKNTLIYAIVGLVIAALAQILVHFVINETHRATLPTCAKGQKSTSANPCEVR